MYVQVLMGVKQGGMTCDGTGQGMYEGVWTAGGCDRRGVVWPFTFVFVVVLKDDVGQQQTMSCCSRGRRQKRG